MSRTAVFHRSTFSCHGHDRGASNKSESERPPSTDEASADSRVVTDTEREDLIEDAKAFRASHEKTFKLLSEGDN